MNVPKEKKIDHLLQVAVDKFYALENRRLATEYQLQWNDYTVAKITLGVTIISYTIAGIYSLSMNGFTNTGYALSFAWLGICIDCYQKGRKRIKKSKDDYELLKLDYELVRLDASLLKHRVNDFRSLLIASHSQHYVLEGLNLDVLGIIGGIILKPVDEKDLF